MIALYAALFRVWSLLALAVAGAALVVLPSLLTLSLLLIFAGREPANYQLWVLFGGGGFVVAVFAIHLLRFRFSPLSRKIRRQFPGAELVNRERHVWVYPSRSVGAYAMPGPFHGAVILSSATLNLPAACIQWIIEHEKAHLRHRDSSHFIWRASIDSAIQTLAKAGQGSLFPYLMVPLVNGVCRHYIALASLLIRLAVKPLRLIRKLMDWRIEYRADHEAAKQTTPQDGIKALSILRDLGMGGLDLRSLIGISSHPPILLRIARLERLKGGQKK